MDNELGRGEHNFLWGRQFMKPFSLEGLKHKLASTRASRVGCTVIRSA